MIAGGIAGLVSRYGRADPMENTMTYLCSFCIAPLDVLKIRLQLQSHSLSDPLSASYKSRRLPPSTIATFKDIFRNEGITVRIAMLPRQTLVD